MSSRRALIVAPTYDGQMCQPIGGIAHVVPQLERLLSSKGDFDTRPLRGAVTEKKIRSEVRGLLDAEDAALFYFYGHGVLRSPGMTVLCHSEARRDEEGYLLSELLSVARQGTPKEVVVVLDCCHAGGFDLDVGTLKSEAIQLVTEPGRVLMAACGANQASHMSDEDAVSLFTGNFLVGLAGSGRLPGTEWVTADSLFTYVSERLDHWEQDPLLLQHTTGQRRCRLVRVPADPVPADGDSETGQHLLLGLPFAPAADFVGREAEIEFLRAFLCEGDRPLSLAATVEGLGGVGKTELVLQLLHDPAVRRVFPTVLWFDASAPLEAQWEYFASLTEVQAGPGEPRAVADALVKSRLRFGRVLIVLDNAVHWESLKELIPPEAALIVTTRSRSFGDSSFIRRELTTLSHDAAIKFLRSLLPDASERSLDRLALRLDGHALALEIAGHYIREMCSPEEYMERLDEAAEMPVELVAGHTHYGTTLESCLQVAWDGIRSDAARSLWIRAALFAPTSAHRELLQITSTLEGSEEFLGMPLRYFLDELGIDPDGSPESVVHLIGSDEFDAAYQELRSAHILGRVDGHNGERWSMHRLVRDFGRKRLGSFDVEVHAGILAGWLTNPTLPVDPEAPHAIAIALDLPRFGNLGERVIGRELLHRTRYWAPTQLGRGLIRHLGQEVNGPHSLSLIFEGIADVNEDVRIAALDLLDEIGPAPAVIDALASTLDDPSPAVRKRAAATIAEHGSGSTMELLESVVGTSERATRSVLELLGSRRSADAVAVLRTAFARLDGDLRLEAAVHLGSLGASEPEVVEVLLGALAEERDSRRFGRLLFAVSQLVDESDDRLVNSLRTVAGSPASPAALLAAEALAKGGDREAAVLLLGLIRSLRPNDRARHQAAAAAMSVDPWLILEIDDLFSATSIKILLHDKEPGLLSELGKAAHERGASHTAEAVAEMIEMEERKARDFRSPAGVRRATEIAKRLTAAGTSTETPDEAHARVLAEEKEKGSDERVAESRARAARARTAKDLLASQAESE